ncbi:MAG: hypothetical protein C4582_04855 [Desulfobacteraceae bacterium]|jgi:aldehyde:ferredoxin oxidoreductase|nr:MAG: hypothetical protein C4582_04855 [Desulfobacteraceae bacterium]
MKPGGFAGKILYVDLAKKEVAARSLDVAMAEKFAGGLGLCIKLAYDIIKPGTGALSPDNPIVLGAGPFVGTNVPSASRIYAVTKLPASGTIGWCGAGGVTFGAQLKASGYDHIIIEGRSDAPVYIVIEDDRIEIRDAAHIWGKDVVETCESLWQMIPWPSGVLSIGRAGEAMIPFSMAFINRLATLGRGGFGAVMGSKNLKAILVRGNGGLEVTHRKQYRHIIGGLLAGIRDYPYLKEWQDLGILKSFPMIPVETYYRIKKRRISCVSCPVGCKEIAEIPDGEFAGLTAHTSSIMNLLTPLRYGFKDYREAVRCASTLDRCGLDMFEFFGIMGMARTLAHKGLLGKGECSPDIVLDSLTSMETWAEKIVKREGIGGILAGGFKGIFEEFGNAARDCAPPLVKGMHPYAGPGAAVPWDLFGTMELGQTLDPRGPHVGASGSPTYFARRPLSVFPRHLVRMGVPEEAIKRILPSFKAQVGGNQGIRMGRLLRYSHAWFSMLGSLGICARAQVNRFYDALLCSRLYEAVTGIDTDLESLRRRADRAWTLLRMANVREGFTRNDDSPPGGWFDTPGFKDYLTDKPISHSDAELMIEDYYDEEGWDRKTGIPTPDRKKFLGLP